MSWLLGRLMPVVLLVAFVALLDFGTKHAALSLPADGVRLLPILDLSLGFNRGISFGLFHDVTGHAVRIALIAFPLCVTAGLIWWAVRTHSAIERAGLALIAGGALGNVIDRMPDGAVTDFISMHASGWYFPTYNLADMAITGGVVLLLWAALPVNPAGLSRRSGREANHQ